MNSTRALETSIQAVDPVSTPCGAGTAGSGAGALAGVWANVMDVARSNRAQAAGTHQRVQPGRRSWSIAVGLPMGRKGLVPASGFASDEHPRAHHGNPDTSRP